MKVTGLEAIQKKLAALPLNVEKKVLRQALRKAIKPMKDEIQGDAPVGETGDLEHSVKVRAGKRKKGSLSMQVGLDQDSFQGEKWYVSFIELGSKFQHAQHFMKKAFDRKATQVRDTAITEIENGIQTL